VIGGNKQRDYITKEDVSSPTVTAEAVMLTCVIDAQENRDVAVVDIPNAFVQTVVSDEDAEHRVTVRIRGPLVDILVSMAPDVYGPYVSVTKTSQKVLIVECLNAVLWNNGGSITILQEVCQEPQEPSVKAQSV
jgi:hypothetical protein